MGYATDGTGDIAVYIVVDGVRFGFPNPATVIEIFRPIVTEPANDGEGEFYKI